MPSNTSASMFGGAGGRGSRASVASLEGLRSVMRNEPDSPRPAPGSPAKPRATEGPAAPPPIPADDKQTLRGLNGRLSGYLDRVRQLKEENENLEKQIDEIMAKRTTPAGRDWDDTEKPLEALKDKIKDIAMDNAKLLLQIDNTKLAKNDFNNKEDDEKKARKDLEKDVDELKKVSEDSRLKCEQTKKELEMVKEEVDRLKKEHKYDVDALRDKIRNSEVVVEIDLKNSNLSENLIKVRSQYDKVARRNLKETDEWYQSKFENIKEVQAQNVEDLNSGKSELTVLLKEKQTLDIKIQTLQSKIRNLEESLKNVESENGRRLLPLNKVILNLQAELEKVRSQVENQVETNKNLLCVKMKLETEINNYQQLIQGMSVDTESSEFILEDALCNEQQPNNADPEMQKKGVIVEQKSTANESTPAEGNPNKTELDSKSKKKKKTKKSSSTSSSSSHSSSSSSSSDSEGEEEKAEKERDDNKD